MLTIPTATIDNIPAAVPELTAVDLSVLAGYEKMQLEGEPDLVIELIDLYLEDAPRRIAVMQESAARSDWQSVKREAHGLRGSSGSLGGVEVVQICGEIEKMESASPGPNIAALLSPLARGLERALHAFRAERERRSQ